MSGPSKTWFSSPTPDQLASNKFSHSPFLSSSPISMHWFSTTCVIAVTLGQQRHSAEIILQDDLTPMATRYSRKRRACRKARKQCSNKSNSENVRSYPLMFSCVCSNSLPVRDTHRDTVWPGGGSDLTAEHQLPFRPR